MIYLLWLSLFASLSLTYFCMLVCKALRSYSISRLEEVCNLRKKPDVFTRVMKQDDQAIYAWEMLGMISIVWIIGSIFCLSRMSTMVQEFPLSSILTLLVLFLFLSYFLIWSLTRVFSEEIILKYWTVIEFITFMSRPCNSLLTNLDIFAKRVTLREEDDTESSYITEEIRTVVDEGEREGLLDQQARKMIHRVMELKDEDVSSVMTPRIDMVSIQGSLKIREARQKLIEAGHSRLPVYNKTPDDIIGILYAKDMLAIVNEDELNRNVSEIVRAPLFLPESSGIHQLLETMKSKRVHIAIVLDEYGGVSGLVTMEDILEEIVGDIADEYDKEQNERIKKIAPTLLEVDARVHLDELNDLYDIGFPEDQDYDTISGYLMSELGYIPRVGESVTCEQTQISVLEADIRKVIKVRIKLAENLVSQT